MSGKKPKRKNLLATVQRLIEEGSYLDSRHAFERRSQRDITRPEILYVLQNGFHEKRKDTYSVEYEEWNYAIRGKTMDGRSLRIIVSFDPEGMLIITAIDLDVR